METYDELYAWWLSNLKEALKKRKKDLNFINGCSTMDKTNICASLTGKRKCRPSRLIYIGRICGVPIHEIFKTPPQKNSNNV